MIQISHGTVLKLRPRPEMWTNADWIRHRKPHSRETPEPGDYIIEWRVVEGGYYETFEKYATQFSHGCYDSAKFPDGTYRTVNLKYCDVVLDYSQRISFKS